jgi:phospholipid/cholesterol/gamma-HCH transport system substrate-binding protein
VKISKEIVTGVIAIFAIGLLIAGINFLKGNSFFGGDEVYYAYLPNSGGIAVASSVMVNGVAVGKVTDIELTNEKDSLKKVLVTFNIQEKGFKIPKGSTIEAGSLDLFNKGLILSLSPDISKGFHVPGDRLQGIVTIDITTQVKAYADPLVKKVQGAIASIDNMVTSLTAFWDTTATSEIEGSLGELKMAIHNLGVVADQVQGLVGEEKEKFSRIVSNVESITANIKKSNDAVNDIVGNAKKFSDELVTLNFKKIINEATSTISSLNSVIQKANSPDGSIGLLLNDTKLYDNLVETNNELQMLVNDLRLHPERYIHISLLGTKTKGVPLSEQEEKRLRELLDTTAN